MISANENSKEFFSDANRKLFDSLNIPVAIADKNRILTWASKRFKILLEGDLSGSNITKLFKITPQDLDRNEPYTNENLFWEVRITSLASYDSAGYLIFLQEKSEASGNGSAPWPTVSSVDS